MKKDHALFFIWNGPREGRESQGMEYFEAHRKYWNERKDSGDVAGFEVVMLASSGNQHMPAGFCLVTGEREKLQKMRWNDDKFLDIHTGMMTSFEGYACVEGYAGEGFDQHIGRIKNLMRK